MLNGYPSVKDSSVNLVSEYLRDAILPSGELLFPYRFPTFADSVKLLSPVFPVYDMYWSGFNLTVNVMLTQTQKHKLSQSRRGRKGNICYCFHLKTSISLRALRLCEKSTR
jgi:hypothetical protein